jgi:NAD(P)-dependent dehydrogenase (short-subunit alcohol dehydrogenase family)
MKKNVLITGASGNLGKASVEKFLEEGYKVIVTVSPGKKIGFETDGEILSYEADLTNEKNVEEVMTKVISEHQSIDAALLLVGGFATGGIKDTDGASLKKMYALNFETAYYAARLVFLQMQKQATGGRIILVGARPSLNATDGKDLLAYALSKSLIFKLAEFLNAEGASQNVVTSVIIPSVIDTQVNRQANPTANFSDWVKPEEIAEVISFITSANGNTLRDSIFKIYGNS